MRRLVPCALAGLTLLASAPSAGVAAGSTSRHLWATVNVCDTIKHRDTIGIRASMPGGATSKQQLWMRFRVQYFAAADQRWHNIRKGGDSGFVKVGQGAVKAVQAGQLFEFAPPAGGSYQMRGKVSFQWRDRFGKKVLRRDARVSTAGHRSTAGADPDGYSSDTCVISR